MQELIIIGAGPAGLSASVYASRYGIKNTVIGEVFGGLTTETHEIGNWLGEKAIPGFEFAQNAEKHAKDLGAEMKIGRVESVEKKGGNFLVKILGGEELETKSIIYALGTRHRHLDVLGEKEFAGKGVSYCATCDGFFYKDKVVGVVGGSNSAAVAAVHLGKIAKKVYMIYRKSELRAEEYWKKIIEENNIIEVIYNANVEEVLGSQVVEKVKLDNEFNGSNQLELNGLFIEIGLDPNTQIAESLGVKTDDDSFIKVDKEMKTSLEGVWAAGDNTDGSNKFQQIVTAAAEGAIAAASVSKYLKSK